MEKRLFSVSNHHTAPCSEPAVVDGDMPGVYHGYFENQHGEQAIFTYDPATGEAVVRMGDAGWENAFPVVDGRVDGLVLGEAESLWLRACWAATGGNRQAASS